MINRTSNLWLIIARKEFCETLRSRFFSGLLLFLLCIFSASTLLGWQYFCVLKKEQQTYTDLVRKQWETQPDRHPHRVSHYGTFAFRPQSALAFFDFGVNSFTGSAIFLEAHKQNTANYSEVRNSTGLIRFGQLTSAMVLQTIAPLLIFFVCFNAFSKERELGTLSILASQGVDSSSLIFGKIIGCSLISSILLLPPALLSAVFLILNAGNSFGFDSLMRIALLVVAYCAYSFLWILLAVYVSARQKESKGALLVLLCLWSFLFIVVPRAVPNIARRIIHTPSQPEFEKSIKDEIRTGGDGHDPEDVHFAKLKNSLLAKYHVSKLEDLPVNFAGISMQAGEEHSSTVYQKKFAALQDLYLAQNYFSECASLFDPYLSIRSLSMSLAGTDFEDFVDFQRRAEEYRMYFINQLNKMQTNEIPFSEDSTKRLASSHWKNIKPFNYTAPDIASDLAHHPIAPLGIVLWLCVLGLLCSKYKMRVI